MMIEGFRFEPATDNSLGTPFLPFSFRLPLRVKDIKVEQRPLLADAQWLETANFEKIEKGRTLYYRSFFKEFSLENPSKIKRATLHLYPEAECFIQINGTDVNEGTEAGQLNTIDITGYDGKLVIIKAKLRYPVSTRRNDNLKPLSSNSLQLSATEQNNQITIESNSLVKTIDLEITVPKKCSLKIQNQDNGDVHVKNLSGEMDISNVNGNINLYAQWVEIPECTVTFDGHGGTGHAPASVTIYCGLSLSGAGQAMPSNPSRSGYSFNNWSIYGYRIFYCYLFR